MPELSPTDLLSLGDPVEHRGVALCPLYPRISPRAEYLTLDAAVPLGLRVSEVDARGSVGELRVTNPTECRVLLYDGEELVGAKQDRVLNVTVLVDRGAELVIPVSCVEAGRWSARSGAMAAAPQTAHPELRRRKAERLAAHPLAVGAAQQAVWSSVDERAEALGSRSPTGSHAEVAAGRARDLATLAPEFPLQPGQCGAVLAVAGQALCLDAVSRPDAFARLYPRLLMGYLMDALTRLDAREAGSESIPVFVEAVARSGARTGQTPGLGKDVRLAGEGVIGSGLVLEGELLQLSAYAVHGDPQPLGVIARPSRRARTEGRGR